nr:hypothetical protein [uncultured Oscillibacter sp.]
MAMRQVDKIIRQAAREALAPMGLFQKGSSRIWLDDNGWFLTVVEFQPSAWSQGAYLNVGASFLWEQGAGFWEALPYNYTFGAISRELHHVEYTGDDGNFYRAMLDMAEHARGSAAQYRARLDTPEHACRPWQERCARRGWNVRDAWNSVMLCCLAGDLAAGDAWLDTILEREPRESGIGWAEALRRLAEETRDLPGRQAFVVRSIQEKRARLRAKASYKKLPVDPAYQ